MQDMIQHPDISKSKYVEDTPRAAAMPANDVPKELTRLGFFDIPVELQLACLENCDFDALYNFIRTSKVVMIIFCKYKHQLLSQCWAKQYEDKKAWISHTMSRKLDVDFDVASAFSQIFPQNENPLPNLKSIATLIVETDMLTTLFWENVRRTCKLNDIGDGPDGSMSAPTSSEIDRTQYALWRLEYAFASPHSDRAKLHIPRYNAHNALVLSMWDFEDMRTIAEFLKRLHQDGPYFLGTSRFHKHYRCLSTSEGLTQECQNGHECFLTSSLVDKLVTLEESPNGRSYTHLFHPVFEPNRATPIPPWHGSQLLNPLQPHYRRPTFPSMPWHVGNWQSGDPSIPPGFFTSLGPAISDCFCGGIFVDDNARTENKKPKWDDRITHYVFAMRNTGFSLFDTARLKQIGFLKESRTTGGDTHIWNIDKWELKLLKSYGWNWKKLIKRDCYSKIWESQSTSQVTYGTYEMTAKKMPAVDCWVDASETKKMKAVYKDWVSKQHGV